MENKEQLNTEDSVQVESPKVEAPTKIANPNKAEKLKENNNAK